MLQAGAVLLISLLRLSLAALCLGSSICAKQLPTWAAAGSLRPVQRRGCGAGNSFMVATSVGLMVHHIFGCWHGDRRLAAKHGDAFEKVGAPMVHALSP